MRGLATPPSAAQLTASRSLPAPGNFPGLRQGVTVTALIKIINQIQCAELVFPVSSPQIP